MPRVEHCARRARKPTSRHGRVFLWLLALGQATVAVGCSSSPNTKVVKFSEESPAVCEGCEPLSRCSCGYATVAPRERLQSQRWLLACGTAPAHQLRETARAQLA
ncbi:hypothetical protein BJ546DRAFT_952201 [Cryomyces antarcticus]